MPYLVLLGDSSLDNAAYVPRGEAVIDHLRRALPGGWQATLLAVDGSRTGGVARQLASLPAGATHLLLSIGGNDALAYQGILRERAGSAADVIDRLADIQAEFAANYGEMLAAVLAKKLPTTLCTIYNPNYPDAPMQRLAVTAATVFEDVILRAAFTAGLPVIDLRLLFSSRSDYANAIEPSSAGGAKIAAAAVRVVQEHDFARGRSEVFV
jgi:lysophospholipase L1-like esterase